MASLVLLDLKLVFGPPVVEIMTQTAHDQSQAFLITQLSV